MVGGRWVVRDGQHVRLPGARHASADTPSGLAPLPGCCRSAFMNTDDPTIPRYQQLKAHILDSIQAGRLRPRDRVPSEQELVRHFGVSRMTANRALRELASDGVVVRQSGVGTFVAESPGPFPCPAGAQHRRRDPRARPRAQREGRHHGAGSRRTRDIAVRLRLRPGAAVFHSLIVHLENDLPIQVEDRYVCAHAAPGYLDQDFTTTTPNEYLSRVAPLQTVEHLIRAENPGRRIRGHAEDGGGRALPRHSPPHLVGRPAGQRCPPLSPGLALRAHGRRSARTRSDRVSPMPADGRPRGTAR